MNLSFIHTADLHIYDQHKYSTGDSKLRQLKKNLLLMVKYAIKNNIDLIIVAGDIFHIYNPSEKLLRILTEVIKLGIKHGIMFRFISGNHDTDGVNIAFQSLKNMDDLSLVTDGDFPMLQFYFHNQNELAVYQEKIRGTQIVYVPWQSNMPEALEKAVEIRANDITNVLVTHCAVDGATTNSGHEMKKTRVGKKVLSGWTYVALGDFHKYQNLFENVYYSGSPIKYIWDERHDKRAFNVVKIGRQLEIKKIILPDDEFIELEINYTTIDAFIKDKITEIDNKKVENSYIKVFINGDVGLGIKINLLKEHLINCGAKEVMVKVISDIKNLDVVSESKNEEMHLNLDILSACSIYLNKQNIVDKNYITYVEKKVI